MVSVPIFLIILNLLSMEGKEKVLDTQGPLCFPEQLWADPSMMFLRQQLVFLLPGGHKIYLSWEECVLSHHGHLFRLS